MTDTVLNSGERLSADFEIIRLLGSGGMGSVYLAKQLSTDALRAVKVMRSRYLDDDGFRRRFSQEARVGSRIKSEHVVEVIAAGIDEEKHLPWLAMEYLEGKTLTAALGHFGVPCAEDAGVLLRQLFHGIEKAHEARIVHRDIKPDNILLAQSATPGAPFRVKVLDFGIAKWLSGPVGDPTDSLWTMLWGAPEQASKGASIGPQADVWSLGLVVFWLYVGEHYWHSERGARETLQEILTGPLVPASMRARELRCARPLPHSFDEWFARCVAHDPLDRFKDAGAAWRGFCEIRLDWPQSGAKWRIEAFRESNRTGYGNSDPNLGVKLKTTGDSALQTAPACQFNTGTTLEPLGASQPAPTEKPSRHSRTWLIGAILGGLLSSAALSVAVIISHQRKVGSVTHPTSTASPLPQPLEAPSGMRWIPDGRGAFGPWDDRGETRPVHASVAGFYLDVDEVSVQRYQRCVAAGSCTPSGLSKDQASSMCNAHQAGREEHPINCVTRLQAEGYCAFVGKRLPTELEWEYAARGSDLRRYPWGNSAPSSCDDAVVSGLCRRRPSPTRAVGSRRVGAESPFGMTDMAGNVWEWVSDRWDERPQLAQGDTRRPASKLGVLRGGAWDHAASRATTTSRKSHVVSSADINIGFRCAKNPGVSVTGTGGRRTR